MDGMKTTPGPWYATHGEWPDQRRHWVDGGGYRVAQGPDSMPDEMAAANARLIAAAPEMFAALESTLDVSVSEAQSYALVKAAIAKAVGR